MSAAGVAARNGIQHRTTNHRRVRVGIWGALETNLGKSAKSNVYPRKPLTQRVAENGRRDRGEFLCALCGRSLRPLRFKIWSADTTSAAAAPSCRECESSPALRCPQSRDSWG